LPKVIEENVLTAYDFETAQSYVDLYVQGLAGSASGKTLKHSSRIYTFRFSATRYSKSGVDLDALLH
jgi:hypothetical protein